LYKLFRKKKTIYEILVCISHVPDTTSKLILPMIQNSIPMVQYVINRQIQLTIWFQENKTTVTMLLNVGGPETEPL
jgi:hypothetical protein